VRVLGPLQDALDKEQDKYKAYMKEIEGQVVKYEIMCVFL